MHKTMKIMALVALVLGAFGAHNAVAAEEEQVTTLYLTETAFKSVEQDRLRISLRIQREEKQPQWVQSYINKNMAVALAEAESLKNADVFTGSYSVYERKEWPRDDEKKEPKTVWYGSQTLTIDTAEPAAAQKVVATLQAAGFTVEGMDYYLSRTKQAEQRDELIAEALEIIRARAARIGRQLGLADVHMQEINFDQTPQNEPGRPMMRAMAMEMAMDGAAKHTPVASPGKTDVEVVVNVKAVLGE